MYTQGYIKAVPRDDLELEGARQVHLLGLLLTAPLGSLARALQANSDLQRHHTMPLLLLQG